MQLSAPNIFMTCEQNFFDEDSLNEIKLEKLMPLHCLKPQVITLQNKNIKY